MIIKVNNSIQTIKLQRIAFHCGWIWISNVYKIVNPIPPDGCIKFQQNPLLEMWYNSLGFDRYDMDMNTDFKKILFFLLTPIKQDKYKEIIRDRKSNNNFNNLEITKP